MAAIRRLAGRFLRAVLPRAMKDLDLGRYVGEHALPGRVPQEHPFVPATMVGHEGIDMGLHEQLERLRRWTEAGMDELFAAIRSDSGINRRDPVREPEDAISNGYYPTPDAEIYSAMIAELRPDLVVEVGSGFSTLVARRAIDHAGTGTRLHVIDPDPRVDVADVADRVTQCRVEEFDLSSINWTARSVLFVDSSHICRVRGDVPLLYCQVIPTLPPGVVVHAHDIYLPYDNPAV